MIDLENANADSKQKITIDGQEIVLGDLFHVQRLSTDKQNFIGKFANHLRLNEMERRTKQGVRQLLTKESVRAIVEEIATIEGGFFRKDQYRVSKLKAKAKTENEESYLRRQPELREEAF